MLSLNEVSIAFDEAIIDAFSLGFKPGSVSVITGNSGSGKSSVIKLINGIIPEIVEASVKGDIVLNDDNLSKLNIMDRADKISSVFQNPKTQFYCINSLDEVAFGLENKNIEREEIFKRIDEYSKLLKTDYLINRDIFSLSGGEKQLVAITSVSCMDTQIYLFDEPSSSLDQNAIKHLRYAIEKLKSLGKIVIVAEHRLYYLKEIMDNLIVIENGRVNYYDKKDLIDDVFIRHNLRTLNEVMKDELENVEIKNLFSKEYDDTLPLQCINYKYSYPGNKIFDMNLSLNKGVNFIIGENGIGKTTFLRCLCGLNKGFRGKTFFHSKIIKKPENYISFVMQDVNYQIFTSSVYEECLVSAESNEKAEFALKFLNLWHLRDKHPQALSGGEKQRLILSQCIASDKPIVIMDEPTSGLCKKNMMLTANAIEHMEKENKVIIIVTHDYEFVKQVKANIIEFGN